MKRKRERTNVVIVSFFLSALRIPGSNGVWIISETNKSWFQVIFYHLCSAHNRLMNWLTWMLVEFSLSVLCPLVLHRSMFSTVLHFVLVLIRLLFHNFSVSFSWIQFTSIKVDVWLIQIKKGKLFTQDRKKKQKEKKEKQVTQRTNGK